LNLSADSGAASALRPPAGCAINLPFSQVEIDDRTIVHQVLSGVGVVDCGVYLYRSRGFDATELADSYLLFGYGHITMRSAFIFCMALHRL
jgi:hypothetical protein